MQLAIRNGGDGNRRKAGIAIRQGRGAGELALREALDELPIRRRRGIDGAVRHARRNGRSAHRAQQSALKGLRVRRIGSHQIGHAARQDVAEQAEPVRSTVFGATCHAMAVLGCRIAAGVAAKIVPCPV